MATDKISGSEALIRSLLEENVKLIYGYPGGAIMPVFDCMHNYKDRLKHVLVRHEQGATHAAQGFARVSGETGVVLVTSGPAATNIITGVADAMVDSTPMVVITGQISSSLLGTDAFQETDVVGITQPVTKWSYQIRRTEDIPWAVERLQWRWSIFVFLRSRRRQSYLFSIPFRNGWWRSGWPFTRRRRWRRCLPV